MTFLEGREEGARVDVVGARESEPRERVGGVRSEEAAEGGGRSDVEGLGGILKAKGVESFWEGWGMEVDVDPSFRLAFDSGRAGGGMSTIPGLFTAPSWGRLKFLGAASGRWTRYRFCVPIGGAS